MPVGKHRPRSSPRGDSSALCDICGVLWYRSRLVRKADGLLYCPDDVRGLDNVTLSEGNARDAVQVLRQRQVRDSGAIDSSGFSTEEMPTGILLDGAAGARQATSLTGWWSPRDLRLQNGVSNMDNIVNTSRRVAKRGDLLQVTNGIRPSYTNSTTTIAFDGTQWLKSASQSFVPISTTDLSVWCVASVTDPAARFGNNNLFHLTDVGGFATYDVSGEGEEPAHGVRILIQDGQVTGYWESSVAGTVTVVAPFTSTSLHLFELRATATTLALYQDNILLNTTTFASSGATYHLDYANFGSVSAAGNTGDPIVNQGMTGVMDELVVYPAAVTTAQATSMATYFSRTYSGLSIS